MTFFYFDTNVLRYFGRAFQSTQLESSLRSRIALSPLSVAELLAQLGGKGSETQEAYDAIQAIRNWVEPTNARILDWPEVFIREHVFGIPTPKAAPLPHVTKALDRCSQPGLDLTSLRKAGGEVRRSWEVIERKSAEVRRSNTLLLRHHKIKAPKDLLLEFSLKTLRSIADATDTKVDRDEILGKLSAYHELEITTLSIALRDHKFQFLSRKRMNDQVDLEQLVYLADDQARYLTSDKRAYRRVKATPQGHRIWIEDPSQLMNAPNAIAILRNMSE